MYVKANIDRIRDYLHLLPVREAVWLALAMRVNEDGVCWPSLKRIAIDISDPSGLNPSRARWVPSAIRDLETLGLLQVVQRGGGRNHPNHYRIPGFVFGVDGSQNSDLYISDRYITDTRNSDKNISDICDKNSDMPKDHKLEPYNNNHTTTARDGTFEKLLDELRRLPEWKATDSDTTWLSEFFAEFPKLNDSHIRACRDYHDGKDGKVTTGIWKNRLRNWMMHEGTFKSDRKTTQDPQLNAHIRAHTSEELQAAWGR